MITNVPARTACLQAWRSSSRCCPAAASRRWSPAGWCPAPRAPGQTWRPAPPRAPGSSRQHLGCAVAVSAAASASRPPCKVVVVMASAGWHRCARCSRHACLLGRGVSCELVKLAASKQAASCSALSAAAGEQQLYSATASQAHPSTNPGAPVTMYAQWTSAPPSTTRHHGDSTTQPQSIPAIVPSR